MFPYNTLMYEWNMSGLDDIQYTHVGLYRRPVGLRRSQWTSGVEYVETRTHGYVSCVKHSTL